MLQSGIRAWFTPWTGWAVCWSCIHVDCICVSCVVGPCACCICMVWVIVVVVLPWEVDGVVVECVIMSVWLIMHSFCMLMFTCGQVYSDVVVVFMHEVVVCFVDKGMH